MTKRAVVLVSGGLDSATCLAIARTEGYACHALSFAYGQRHTAELDAAARVTAALGAAEHRVMQIDLAAFGGSALTDPAIPVPEEPSHGVPVTYVPARNTVFLSYALAWSEILGAHDIFIGVNAVDYSGYPDCRPEYIAAFERMANLATRAGTEGREPLFIRNVRGFGYAFCGAVEEEAAKRVTDGSTACRLEWGKREIALREGENVLGRTQDAVAWLDSASVSRRHARIVVSGGSATIEDLGSKNGTCVSGRRIDGPTPLEGGDQIELGSVLMTFRVFRAAGSTETKRSRR